MHGVTYNHRGVLSKQDLATNNIDLAKMIAKYFYKKINFSLDLEELIELAQLGLMEAVHSYEQKNGAEFKTYATYRIKGYILDELRKNDPLTQKQREIYKKIQNFIHKSFNQSKCISEQDIAKQLNISLDEYFYIVEHHQKSEESEELDALMSETDFVEELEKKELSALLKNSISELSEREKLILQLIYVEECSFSEVAHILDISKTRASQLHSSILLKVREKINFNTGH